MGGFDNYSDNNYKMKSPFQEGLTITRDHDKFKKAVVGGSFKARKWWFDLVEFEPVFIRTYKDVQGIESNIQYAHSHSDAFIIANKMEKENFLLEGLDLDWQLGMFIPTIILLIPPLIAHIGTDALSGGFRIRWRNRKWASLLANNKHQLQHKLNLNYLVNDNHLVNFNSLSKYAHANPEMMQ